MNKNNLGVKIRRDVWYGVLLERIAETKKPNSDIIKFPDLFSGICVKFSLPKKEAWTILLKLHKAGLITIVKGHGILTNFSIKEVNQNV